MTFVVTENCIKCKYTDCVEVCPVDCFYEGPNFLVINPDECIDCALCEDDLSEEQRIFMQLNAELSPDLPNITAKKEGLPDAKSWENVSNKREHLEREWPEKK